MRNKLRWVLFGIGALVTVALLVPYSRSAIQTISGLAVAQSSTQWNSLRDASVGDTITNGVGVFNPYLWNGSSFDRARGSVANGLAVDVTRIQGNVTVIGGATPAETFANPTTAITSWSLAGLFNGTTWDRWKSGVITGQALTDNSSNAVSRIIANTTTTVKSTAGVVNLVIDNAIGTTSTATFYNIAGAGCTGTPGSGFVAVLQTVTLGSMTQFNHTFTLGICVVTAGAAAADISVLYR